MQNAHRHQHDTQTPPMTSRSAARRGWMLAPAAAATALLAAGCGTAVIDAATVEDAIKRDVAEAGLSAQVEKVTCPTAEQSKTGHRFDCTVKLTAGGSEAIPVVVTDGERGNVAFGTEARQ